MPPKLDLYENEFATYYLDEEHSAIEQCWTSATQSMNEAQFREGIERLAGFIEKKRMPHVLVDMTDIRYRPQSDFNAWREVAVIPRYNAAGVKKFAFAVPADATYTVEKGHGPAVEGAASFPTGYFNARNGAYAWFAADAVDSRP